MLLQKNLNVNLHLIKVVRLSGGDAFLLHTVGHNAPAQSLHYVLPHKDLVVALGGRLHVGSCLHEYGVDLDSYMDDDDFTFK